MLRYSTLLNHYLMESLLRDALRMSRKFSTKSPQETKPLGLNAAIALLKRTAGKTLNLENNSLVKVATQDGSGTLTSQTSGVTMTIQYSIAKNEPAIKIFKLKKESAYDFIQELNEEARFATLKTEGQTLTLPIGNITEIRIEEEDVNTVSESKRKEVANLGSN